VPIALGVAISTQIHRDLRRGSTAPERCRCGGLRARPLHPSRHLMRKPQGVGEGVALMGERHSEWEPARVLQSRERISEPCAVHRAWFLSDRSVQLPSTRTLFVRNRESDGARDIGATRARRAPGGCRRRRSTRPAGPVRRCRADGPWPERWFREHYAHVFSLPPDEARQEMMRFFADPDQFEQIGLIPLGYNRAILLMAQAFHGTGETFGDSPETGRLSPHFEFYAA
jgi:hypothetical protein